MHSRKLLLSNAQADRVAADNWRIAVYREEAKELLKGHALRIIDTLCAKRLIDDLKQRYRRGRRTPSFHSVKWDAIRFRNLVYAVRDEGYNVDCRDPIRIINTDSGGMFVFDGTHRIAILMELERQVPAIIADEESVFKS